MSKAARRKPSARGSARRDDTPARPSARADDAPASAPAAASSSDACGAGSAGSSVTLRIAVWLLAAEAVALGALAGLLVYGDLRGGAQRQQGAVGVIGYVLVLAAVLGLLAWALRRRRAWARGPAIVLHMLLFPFGIAFTTSGQPMIGVIAILASLGGCVALLAPGTRVALGRD